MHYPPLERWHRYPVTVGISLGASLMTVWWWSGGNADRWMLDDRFWSGQIWQPLTSCLLHGNIVHLGFNLVAFWVLGTFLEEVYGPAKYLAVVIFLSIGSALAEYACTGGGIGLSGMLYGLVGMYWVLRRKDRRFLFAIDDSTIKTAIGWFFLCIVLTYTKVMPIGNVAHGSGAVLGILLGFAVGERNKRRKIGYALLLFLATAMIFAAASVGRPYVNFTGAAERELEMRANRIAQEAIVAYDNGDYRKAADLFAKALEIDGKEPSYWYNLGLCRVNLGQWQKAREAFERASELDSENPRYKKIMQMQPPSE